jgi:hypothetical protein
MEELIQELRLSFECTQRAIVAGATFCWLSEDAWSIVMMGLRSNSKNAIQRQADKEAMWGEC